MFGIETTTSGAFAFIQQPRKKRESALAGLWTVAITQALREYATGVLRPANIKDRFKAGAGSVYNFQRRSPSYEMRQRKINGGVTPYFSPRRSLSIQALATATAKFAAGQGSAQSVIAAYRQTTKQFKAVGPRARDLVTRAGGHAIRTRPGRRVRTVISYPGMRILNRAGPKSKVYRDQFRDLTLGGGRDARAILARAQVLFQRGFKDLGNSFVPVKRRRIA